MKICVTVLDRNDTARGETRAIAAAIDLVKDRHLGIARAQEIGVERMADAAFDRAAGGHQRLAQHLPAEHALHAVLGRDAAEDIVLDLLEIEQAEDFFDEVSVCETVISLT